MRANYDVAVIGGGIVGLATAYQLLLRKPGLTLAVVEKESELASHQTGLGWIAVWIGEAFLALAIGIAGAELKSRRAKLPLLSGPARKFVAGFAPAMAAGALLTAVLFRSGNAAFLPGIWMLLYGAAIVSGGWASVRVVPLMGACFMAAGAAALWWPAISGDACLAAGFGGLHIVFGTVIAVKYGG